jgi:nucleoside-diphosphate-sugar epimerase
MKALVIGGTLFIGRRLVRRLLEDGFEVAVLHRSPRHDLPPEIENLVADRNDAAQVRRALAGRRFDFVFDNVYDWDRGTTARQVVDTVRACSGGLRRYVFMSSVAAYGEGLDRREEDPLAPEDHPNPYVRNKASSERALFRLHRTEGLPVVTLRPPFVYGPENPFYREAFFWDRIDDGRPIIVPGDGSRLMQFVYVEDLVWVCRKVIDEPAAVGQAFNVAHERAITQVEAVRAMAEAAGKPARLVFVPRERIQAAGGSVMGPDRLYFGAYYDVPPITERIDKARRLLGFKPSNFLEALRKTYAWYCEHRRPKPDYSFEDALLASG